MGAIKQRDDSYTSADLYQCGWLIAARGCKLVDYYSQNGHVIFVLSPRPSPSDLELFSAGLAEVNLIAFRGALRKLRLAIDAARGAA